MRSIEEYMRLPYRMEVIPDTAEGGFVVRFPELPGCLTCADSLEEAVRNAADCKKNISSTPAISTSGTNVPST